MVARSPETAEEAERTRRVWHLVGTSEVHVVLDAEGCAQRVVFVDDGFELVGLAAKLWADDHVDELTPELGVSRR